MYGTQTNSMTSTLLSGFLVMAGGILFSTAAAWEIDRKRRAKHASARPFRWCYAQGLMLIGLGTLGMLANWGHWWMLNVEFVVMISGFRIIAGFLILRPRRWSFILGTLLSYYPLLWLINSIYLAMRWKEFRDEAAAARGQWSSLTPPPILPPASS